MNIAKMLLFIVLTLQLVGAGAQLFVDEAATFEEDTGVAWKDLTSAFPTVATQVSMSRQASLIANMAVGLLSLLILQFAFSEGKPWAWYAMWIMPLSAIPGVVNLWTSDNPVWVAIFGGTIIALAIFALAISYRSFFAK